MKTVNYQETNMERSNYHLEIKSRLCKKVLISIASIILVISSTMYFINVSSANSEIVEIANVPSNKLLDDDVLLARNQLLSIQYKPINVPASADIRIFSNDLDNILAYTAGQVDLSQRLSYSFSAKLTDGIYAAVISSPEIITKVIPFSIIPDRDTTIDLGSFELYQTQGLTDDINDDGAINALDFQISHL